MGFCSEPTLSRLQVPLFSLALDVLRLLLIEVAELGSRLRVRAQQFVELGVNGLRVAVLGALDKQRHEPGRKRGDGVPVEGRGLEQEPQGGVTADNAEGEGMCRQYAQRGKRVAQRLSEIFHFDDLG